MKLIKTVLLIILVFNCSDPEQDEQLVNEAELFDIGTFGGHYNRYTANEGWGYVIGYNISNTGNTDVTGWSVAWSVDYILDDSDITKIISEDINEIVHPGQISERHSKQVNVIGATGTRNTVLLGFNPRFE